MILRLYDTMESREIRPSNDSMKGYIMRAINKTTTEKTTTEYYVSDTSSLLITREVLECDDSDGIKYTYKLMDSDITGVEYKVEVDIVLLGFASMCVYAELSREHEMSGNGWECVANRTNLVCTRNRVNASINELAYVFVDYKNIPYQLRCMADTFAQIALDYPEIF